MSIKNFIGFSLILTLVYGVAISLCKIALDNLCSGNLGKFFLAIIGTVFVIFLSVVILRKLAKKMKMRIKIK